MSAQQLVELSQQYNEQATHLKQVCETESRRMVSLGVFFHLPDSPHILRDFVWQTEDRFAASDKVAEQLDQTARAFVTAASLSADALDATTGFLIENIKSMHDHALRMKHTDDHFEIPFHDHDPRMHVELVEAVPFARTRQFLSHWLHHIDGPLHTVAITHQRLV